MNGDVQIVDDVAEAFADVVVENAPRSIALSGGETARVCYEQLRNANVAWNNVTVLFGDERWVPVNDSKDIWGSSRNEGPSRRVRSPRE